MKKFLTIVLTSWAVFFCGWFFVYKTGINSLAIQSEDTIPAIFLPVTIIKEGTLYADSYYQMIIEKYPHPNDQDYAKGLTPFYFKHVNGHYISAFPLIAGLLSVPICLIPLLLGISVNWDNLILLSHLSASFTVALSGGFLYLLAKKFIDDKKSILLAVIYLFATVNFAMVSQSLWQHGAVQLFTVLSLLFLFKDGGKTTNLFLSGAFLGLAVLSRPTAGILVPFFTLLVIYLRNKKFIEDKISFNNLITAIKPAILFLCGLIPSLAFFVWYNAAYFVDISNQGYASQVATNWLTPFPLGFLGLWASPSKGILVYSSLFLFSLFGACSVLKNGRWKKNFVYFVFLSIILTYTLVLGSWKHWYGGYSFGYRMACDILPFLVLLLVPYFKSSVFGRTKRLFYASVVLSVLFELMGLAFFDGIWHGTYDRGFWKQGWLWSLQNSEISFNIERLLVKLGL